MNHRFIPNQTDGGNDRIRTANEGISGLLTPTDTSRKKLTLNVARHLGTAMLPSGKQTY